MLLQETASGKVTFHRNVEAVLRCQRGAGQLAQDAVERLFIFGGSFSKFAFLGSPTCLLCYHVIVSYNDEGSHSLQRDADEKGSVRRKAFEEHRHWRRRRETT